MTEYVCKICKKSVWACDGYDGMEYTICEDCFEKMEGEK